MLLRLFLIVEVIFLIKYSAYPQIIFTHGDIGPRYESFEELGSSRNGIPYGKWVNVSNSGVIYREYYYNDLGKPVGTWKQFFPDGGIRKIWVYRYGFITKYSRYYMDTSLYFVLTPQNSVPDFIFKGIDEMEDRVFHIEGLHFKINYTEPGYRSHKKIEIRFDYQYGGNLIINSAIQAGFIGEIEIWDTEGRHWKKCLLNGSNILSTVDHYNRKGRLTEQYNYDGNSLVKKTLFDRDGNVKKIKEYHHNN
jgi:antitoxin component YwqK of YwqJK toxin-antitoxin module